MTKNTDRFWVQKISSIAAKTLTQKLIPIYPPTPTPIFSYMRGMGGIMKAHSTATFKTLLYPQETLILWTNLFFLRLLSLLRDRRRRSRSLSLERSTLLLWLRSLLTERALLASSSRFLRMSSLSFSRWARRSVTNCWQTKTQITSNTPKLQTVRHSSPPLINTPFYSSAKQAKTDPSVLWSVTDNIPSTAWGHLWVKRTFKLLYTTSKHNSLNHNFCSLL